MTATFLGLPTAQRPSLPTAPAGVGHLRGDESFPDAARTALRDGQLRANLGHATTTIRDKRARVVAELSDWAELREAGRALKAATMARLDEHLVELERQVTARGGTVHWARDANEANEIVTRLVQATGASEVVKVKSMATQEIGLNEALEAAGLDVFETDLAELIVQLGEDKPSHILVPAIHKNRAEIREIFARTIPGVDPDLTDEPRQLAMAARAHLRERFLRARVAVSGANFGVAETGTLCVVESEGNGRMCLTLPDTLITVMGIEKVVPTWRDLEVFLQLLPRSSTGERMNPYTSTWAGVTPGDGPQEFHLVLLDNGRTAVLADEVGREALHCIRCSACLNVCPVYERAGGHSYGSVYPGPIGAILSPQLTGVEDNASLPYASSLCGACYDVCPVAIDIPKILVHLRGEHVEAQERVTPEAVAFRALSKAMSRPWLWHLTQRASRLGRLIARGKPTLPNALPPPISSWTRSRDLPTPPTSTFVESWTREHGGSR
jgi:L-lactate dehydrogenase complex protein LldF